MPKVLRQKARFLPPSTSTLSASPSCICLPPRALLYDVLTVQQLTGETADLPQLLHVSTTSLPTFPNSSFPGGPCPLFMAPVPLPPGTGVRARTMLSQMVVRSPPEPQSRGKEAPHLLGNPGFLTASAFLSELSHRVMMCPAGWQLGLILCLRPCRMPRWCL